MLSVAQTTVDTVRINESFNRTNLYSVIKQLQKKYRVSIETDSLLLSPYTVTAILTNVKLKSALDTILADHKNLHWIVDNGNRIKIINENREQQDKNTGFSKDAATEKNSKFKGKPTKTNITVSGVIKDARSGEALPYAIVCIKGTQKAAVTNIDGYFTLFNVPTDTTTLNITFVGYQAFDYYLNPTMNLSRILIPLTQVTTQINEVTVMSQRNNILQASEGVSEMKMSPVKLAELPSLGDKDIFRALQLMPGVSAANEASSGLYVRGGTPDQNLVLFDGFTVYNQQHLYGMFSAFNSNAVKDITLYKGGFEAKYGGRISSVVDIIGKTGNTKEFNAGLDASFLGVNGFVEIPLFDNGSIFLSGRRSFQSFLYNDIFNAFNKSAATTSASTSSSNTNFPSGGRENMGRSNGLGRNIQQTTPKTYFYDLNGKITYNFTPKDVVSLSAFNGQDNLDNSSSINRAGGGATAVGSTTDLSKWGNSGSSLKWSRKWSDRFYMNNLLSFSNYYSLRNISTSRTVDRNDTTTKFITGSAENNQLYDYSFKSENEYKFSQNNQLEFGIHATEYKIKYDYTQNDTLSILGIHNTAMLGAVYVQDRLTFFQKFHLLPGMRYSYYQLTDKTYFEPRFQTSYDLTPRVKLKGSWGTFYQFCDRIMREDIANGSSDIWILADGQNVPVSKSVHYIAGASYETGNWLFDVEGYYKDLSGLSQYTLRFTSEFGQGTKYNELFYKGIGFSKGIDFLVQRKFGDFTGWVGYTLGQTLYQFDAYGSGYYPAPQDVTNEFKIVGIYTKGRWSFSATWIYTTGKPFTEPLGTYSVMQPNGTSKIYAVTSSEDGVRYPDYHRLDIAAKYKFLLGNKIKSEIGLSIFNVYNRKNIWYKQFSFDQTGLSETDVTLLGFTPNLSISFKLK